LGQSGFEEGDFQQLFHKLRRPENAEKMRLRGRLKRAATGARNTHPRRRLGRFERSVFGFGAGAGDRFFDALYPGYNTLAELARIAEARAAHV